MYSCHRGRYLEQEIKTRQGKENELATQLRLLRLVCMDIKSDALMLLDDISMSAASSKIPVPSSVAKSSELAAVGCRVVSHSE